MCVRAAGQDALELKVCVLSTGLRREDCEDGAWSRGTGNFASLFFPIFRCEKARGGRVSDAWADRHARPRSPGAIVVITGVLVC